MDKQELTEVLEQLAVKDLAEGEDINNHPCSVAVRAIEQCFDDIEVLRSIADPKKGRSKRCQMLIGLNYNPSF